jgi:hypothetical protein
MLISAAKAAMMMLFFCPDAPNALRTGRQIAGDGRPACMGENLCGRDAKKNDVFKKTRFASPASQQHCP